MVSRNGDDDASDRLSDLPDAILHQILSDVDMKEVVQTCILSKRWKHLWASVPTINIEHFRWMDEPTLNFKTEQFINFVNQVLLHCEENPNFNKLTLNGEGFEHETAVEDWVMSAVLLRVPELHLERIDLRFPSVVGFVKTLRLTSVYLTFGFPSSWNRLYLRLEDVENLIMEDCDYSAVSSLIVDAPLLKYLMVQNYDYGYDKSNHCEVRIAAPNLTSLELKGCLFSDYNLRNFASLVTADIQVETEKLDKQKQVFVKCLNKILRAISNVESLTLSVNAFQIFQELPDGFNGIPVFQNLRCLKLKEWHKDGYIGAMGKLIYRFPYAETIVLERTEKTFDPEMKGGDWEAQLSSFQCPFSHLKTIEIQNLEGCENEFKFLEFLLKNAVVLEKITIKERKVLSVDKENELIEFSKKLQSGCFATTSVKVELMLQRETGLEMVLEEDFSSSNTPLLIV